MDETVIDQWNAHIDKWNDEIASDLYFCWEIDLLTHEGQNGNTIIFAPDVTDRDIEDAVKELRQQNADDKVQVATE